MVDKSYVKTKFVLQIFPETGSIVPEEKNVNQFKLTFGPNELEHVDQWDRRFHDRIPWSKKVEAHQIQWLIETFRIWKSIQDTPVEERRDDKWVVPFASILHHVSWLSSASLSSQRLVNPATSEPSSTSVSSRYASSSTSDLSTLNSNIPVWRTKFCFNSLLSHPAPDSRLLMHFREEKKAIDLLKSFSGGFVGHFIEIVQLYTDTHSSCSGVSSTGVKDTSLDLMVGGSAPLAAMCVENPFTPNDLDFYIKHISNRKIRILHSLILQLIERVNATAGSSPSSSTSSASAQSAGITGSTACLSLVILRKPFTLTWSIFDKKTLSILHRLQLNLLNVTSWAEVFAVYHSDMTCAGFDITANRFVVMYDRWMRFYRAISLPGTATGTVPRERQLVTTSAPSPFSNTAQQGTGTHAGKTWAERLGAVAPRDAKTSVTHVEAHESYIYFSNFLNLDTGLSLNSAVFKYQTRGFLNAHAVNYRDSLLDLTPNPLSDEMELSAGSIHRSLRAVRLRYWKYNRNHLIGWIWGLSNSRLFKLSSHIDDLLTEAPVPDILDLRWLGSPAQTNAVENPNSNQVTEEKKEEKKVEKKQEKNLDWQIKTVRKRKERKPSLLNLSDSSLSIAETVLPRKLLEQFQHRRGAAFLLAPIVLAVEDDIFNNVYGARDFLNALTNFENRVIPFDANIVKTMQIEQEYEKTIRTTLRPRKLFHKEERTDQEKLSLQWKKKESTLLRNIAKEISEEENNKEEAGEEEEEGEKNENWPETYNAEPRPVDCRYRYTLMQLTNILLENDKLSHQEVSKYYPWVIRYFQTKYILYRKQSAALVKQNLDMLPDLRNIIASYI